MILSSASLISLRFIIVSRLTWNISHYSDISRDNRSNDNKTRISQEVSATRSLSVSLTFPFYWEIKRHSYKIRIIGVYDRNMNVYIVSRDIIFIIFTSKQICGFKSHARSRKIINIFDLWFYIIMLLLCVFIFDLSIFMSLIHFIYSFERTQDKHLI